MNTTLFFPYEGLSACGCLLNSVNTENPMGLDCVGGRKTTCITGSNTPETKSFGFEIEKALADEATLRLSAFVAKDDVSFNLNFLDNYDCVFAVRKFDFSDVSATFIVQCLAVSYVGDKPIDWCLKLG